MAPQIKQDLNRSGWETTDFPSVCENCLPDNPYVQMLKEDHGAECKLCTRPFTLFKWKADRTSRQKVTNICLTCARLKNCCQSCMLDLSFGPPLAVRDAALKMVAPGPRSDVNREYYAQEHEKEIEEGRGAIEEAYGKTDEKARELLRRLANSEPYYKKQRRLEAEAEEEKEKRGDGEDGTKRITAGPGPVRNTDTRVAPRPGPYNRHGGSGPGRPAGRAGRTNPSALPTPADIAPPADPNITSLFVTGVEDDLPEHELRKFFTPFGALRSLVCSHRAHCAFINYVSRDSAEKAAAACQGRAIIKGCPLRVGWGKPKPLDSMDNEERMRLARQGRDMQKAEKATTGGSSATGGSHGGVVAQDDLLAAVPPPGQEDVQYASLKGD